MANSSTTDSSDSNGHETCFLDLSAELRNEIYELALFPDEQSAQPATTCQLNFSDATMPMVPEPGLLRSCSQARADASAMFYGRTSFEIPLIHLTTFINATKPENLAAIRNLRIHDYLPQSTVNVVGICKAIVAIKASPLRMDAVKVCMKPPFMRAECARKFDDRDHPGYGLQCVWKSLVELEDYNLQHLERVVKTDSIEARWQCGQAIAPKQLEGVIERVKMTKTQDDELSESMLYVARHYKYLKGWKSGARAEPDTDDESENDYGLL
ncbi:hypothetical protein HII31_02049 [Pseudocercospora fuligena]|uniref:Uncharacterized protein n=1 Tax=Pseudocercospora fuligena TaxID=685502 RepID=A0A8H6VQD7_9PEZI|nr:hypothetical protein HII31_02049 [Pseudocercospora fuligena]